MDTSQPTSKTVIGYIVRIMVGQDLEQARQRMRLAWLAGFIITGVFFINAAIAIWGLAPESEERLPLGLFIFAMVEVGIVAFLSYGVLRRRKEAATVLFFYFWISRIFWIALGIISLSTIPEILKFLVWQILPAYIFFQGLRGAWTYHYLTHPQYPDGT
jgi:hypothetical protein